MSGLTFGQLVESQMKSDPSPDVVKAGEYEIPFGKHKGMNLSMLMEQQHSYCMWLINQEESKNKHFNDTCNNIKLLIESVQAEILDADKADMQGGFLADGNMMPKPVMKVDGVELVEGEKAILHIDPAKPESNGVYEVDTTGMKNKLPVGFLMGKVSQIMKQVEEEDLLFYFNHEDEQFWIMLVKEWENGTDSFVVIETKDVQFCAQSIAKMITLKDLRKRKGVIQNA